MIDFVRARMIEILTLEIDVGATRFPRQLFAVVQGRRSALIRFLKHRKLRTEGRVLFQPKIFGIHVVKFPL